MARVLKGRYFPNTNILNAGVTRQGSFIWNSLLHGRDLIKKRVRLLIGSGKIISTWRDPWLQTSRPRAPIPISPLTPDLMVSNFIKQDQSGWNEEFIRNYVIPQDAEEILAIKLFPFADQDHLICHYNKSGAYSVKSRYWLATHDPTETHVEPLPGNLQIKQMIWKLPTTPKLKHFLWKLITISLPIGQNLQRRHVSHSVKCPHCYQEETNEHLFFDCFYAQRIWRASGLPNNVIYQAQIPFEDKFNALLPHVPSLPENLRHLPWWILWRLWKCRNRMIFFSTNLPTRRLHSKQNILIPISGQMRFIIWKHKIVEHGNDTTVENKKINGQDHTLDMSNAITMVCSLIFNLYHKQDG